MFFFELFRIFSSKKWPFLKWYFRNNCTNGCTFFISQSNHKLITNCSTSTLQRILKRAGIKPWPRLFQNLRTSRETELAFEYPLHIATARIAERHYLQIPDMFYEKAIKAAHIPSQYDVLSSAMNSTEQKGNLNKNQNNEVFTGRLRLLADQYYSKEWRRRESNPHFRDATAACSRYTTSPWNTKVFYTIVSKKSKVPFVKTQNFFNR